MDDIFKEAIKENKLLVEASIEILDVTIEAMSKGEFLSKLAKMYRKLYDELLKENFTEDQAMEIVTKFKIDNRGK